MNFIFQWGLFEWLVIASFGAVFLFLKLLFDAGYRRVQDPEGDAEEALKNEEEWAILSNPWDYMNPLHDRD
jgi:hypothetical protein